MALTFTAPLLPTIIVQMTAKIKLREGLNHHRLKYSLKICQAMPSRSVAVEKCSYGKSSSARQTFSALQHAHNQPNTSICGYKQLE